MALFLFKTGVRECCACGRVVLVKKRLYGLDTCSPTLEQQSVRTHFRYPALNFVKFGTPTQIYPGYRYTLLSITGGGGRVLR